ncbi:hypothetical protein [Aetokthonos hydrillicola]|uniref:hypothetical protein n=1 Tax=Aetokthonos hydrillicola TaxID=1550245 RepID=UPI001ABA549E
MPKLPEFDPPANQNDFLPNEEKEKKAFRTRWSDNINRFTEQTLQNDPWSSVNQPYRYSCWNKRCSHQMDSIS